MTLHVQTARVSFGGLGRLDITAKGKDPLGRFFAPSWPTLNAALKVRSTADELRKAGYIAQAETVEQGGWERYVPRYLSEMRASYRAHPDKWAELLGRPRVVLVCYCTDAERCHRRLLAAEVLSKLGAVDEGEVRVRARRAMP